MGLFIIKYYKASILGDLHVWKAPNDGHPWRHFLDDHWAPDKPLPFSRHLAASRGRCVRGAMEPGILTFNQVIDTLKKSLIFWHWSHVHDLKPENTQGYRKGRSKRTEKSHPNWKRCYTIVHNWSIFSWRLPLFPLKHTAHQSSIQCQRRVDKVDNGSPAFLWQWRAEKGWRSDSVASVTEFYGWW